MTSITLNSPNYASDWLKGEGSAGEFFSRDQIVLAAGNGVLTTGTVLGQISIGGATSATKASGANTGNGTLVMDGTTPVLANASTGVYTARVITAGTNSATFRITDPKGTVLGDVSYSGAGTSVGFADRVKFVVTDGSTDFIVGDGFDITVASGSGKYAPASATAADGTQTACAILFDQSVDTTSADQPAIAITRHASVSHAGLVWGSTINSATLRAAAAAQLKSLGIIDRQAA